MSLKSIKEIIGEAIEVSRSMQEDPKLLSTIQDIIDKITKAYKKSNKVLFCGNGGSAADAQHLAAELSGRFYLDRDPLNAEALHVNTSYLTAAANDYSYEEVYSRLVLAKGDPGDILIGISTSGNSMNVVKALKTAKTRKMVTVGFTGKKKGKMERYCDLVVKVPSTDTPRIQEAHILLGQIICEKVEHNLFG